MVRVRSSSRNHLERQEMEPRKSMSINRCISLPSESNRAYNCLTQLQWRWKTEQKIKLFCGRKKKNLPKIAVSGFSSLCFICFVFFFWAARKRAESLWSSRVLHELFPADSNGLTALPMILTCDDHSALQGPDVANRFRIFLTASKATTLARETKKQKGSRPWAPMAETVSISSAHLSLFADQKPHPHTYTHARAHSHTPSTNYPRSQRLTCSGLCVSVWVCRWYMCIEKIYTWCSRLHQ